MKLANAATLFAVAAYAQNEFPDPDFSPRPTPALDTIVADVKPFILELIAIKSSVVALDKAIIAVTQPADIPAALQANQVVLDTINAQAADALTHPAVSEQLDQPGGSEANGPILDYTLDLIYHINHTVVNLVIKQPEAVQFCQGPTILQAIKDQGVAAQGYIDNVTPKQATDLQPLVSGFVQPIFDALSSASSAYADQTTTSPGCTPPPVTTASSTTSEAQPTSTGGTTAPTGATVSGGWDNWSQVTSKTTLHKTYASTITAAPPKPTAWSEWESTTKAYHTTAQWSAVSPVPTHSGKPYTGGAVANNVCIGTVIFAGLAAFLL